MVPLLMRRKCRMVFLKFWSQGIELPLECLKVNSTSSSGSRAQPRLPVREASLFANLLISRSSMGNRSYGLFLLRAFKRSVEAEGSAVNSSSLTSGGWQAGGTGDWHFCIAAGMQQQLFKTLQTVLVSEESIDCGQKDGTLMIAPGLPMQWRG